MGVGGWEGWKTILLFCVMMTLGKRFPDRFKLDNDKDQNTFSP